MHTHPNRVLIVDDEPGIRDFVATVAEGLGFEARGAGDAEEFRRMIRDFAPTAVVLDLNLPDADGVELLRFLAEEKCRAKILIASGVDTRVLSTVGRLGTTLGLNVITTLQKPIMIDTLEDALHKAMDCAIGEYELQEAIASKQLQVYFQPKIHLQGRHAGSMKGAEALLRWHHPKLGSLLPCEFLPLAEKSGLLKALTDYVLQETVMQLREWKDSGLDVNVCINMPPQFITDLRLPDRLCSLLREFGLDSSSLTLEITEDAAMNATEVTMDILSRLRLKGVSLSIDDFGTGYSSLKQLFHLPFSELKIDRSFVSEVLESEEARTIVKVMIQLAHSLHMTVCAEGVESPEGLEFLAAEGCDSAQGYTISVPLSAEGLRKFVSQHGGSRGARARFATA